MCLVTLTTPPRFKNPMSKGEPAANRSFTSHILCFPAPFYKDLRLAQKGESTYLIWATFDNLFHFTQHTGLILMSHAVSAHLSSSLFSHKLPALPRATFFTEEQDKEEKPSWLKLWKVSCPNQSARSSVRQAGRLFSPTRVDPHRRGKVFTTTFQSSIDPIWCQLKVTKTLALPYAAAALQNHGIWLWEWNYQAGAKDCAKCPYVS